MNEHKIKKYYITLTVVNLVIALIFTFLPSELEISERVKTAVQVNIVFHGAYQGISRFFIWVFELISKDNPNNFTFHIKFFIGFAFVMMILPFLSAVFIFKSVIFEQEYQNLFNLIFLSGMVLGGYSMKSKFKDKLTPRTTS
ncbi:hypothetical protein [Reichenbachiella ulvae]|uniref:Uncharacterized protein n=1 Tax=Reichenbachiella ulvae TaxID=2980104 RepID=A0ABT3CRE9_9BACT|nr:hypothetical protein [Reichenbachiella ulvae]MCV9386079.1 hypothetical protein [Reichenbachiella ulvae]